MEREIMPDYAAEAFCQYLIPPDVFEGSENSKQEVNRYVVPSKKADLRLFNIHKDVAAAGGARNLFNDEIYMTAPSMKVVLGFKKA